MGQGGCRGACPYYGSCERKFSTKVGPLYGKIIFLFVHFFLDIPNECEYNILVGPRVRCIPSTIREGRMLTGLKYGILSVLGLLSLPFLLGFAVFALSAVWLENRWSL